MELTPHATDGSEANSGQQQKQITSNPGRYNQGMRATRLVALHEFLRGLAWRV